MKQLPESIASWVGHGEYGLRIQRCRSEIYNTSAYQKHVFVDIRPDKRVQGWTLETGTTWQAPVSFFYDNQVLDIIRCRTNLGFLRRMETLALCQATSLSYFYDPDAAAALWAWDDGSTLWDGGGITWDSNPVLYVNLGGSNPNNNVVVAILGLYVANVETVQPSFGEDITLDPGLEQWTPPGRTWLLNQYGEAGSGAQMSLLRTDTDVKQGLYAADINVQAAAAASETFTITQDRAAGAIPGKPYWFEGYYQTGANNAADLLAQIAVGDFGTSRWVREDGRTASATQFHTLPPTYGEWLRWSFPFIMPIGSGDLRIVMRAFNTTLNGGGGLIRFDYPRVRRIWRWNYYYPWLPPGGLPAVDVGRKDGYYGNWTVGLGSMKLLNAMAQDGVTGKLDSVFTRLNWMGQEVVVRSGGRFPGGGPEVLFDEVGLKYVGVVKDHHLNDEAATIPMAEQRELLKIQMPLDSYTTTSHPGVIPRFNGRGRGYVFGNSVDNLTPTRVLLRSDGLPIMEVAARCDLTSGNPKVRVYVDEEAAQIRNLNRAVTLTSGEWATYSGLGNGSGTIELTEVPGPFEIVAGVNDALDLVVDGNTRAVFLTPGLYRLEANGSASTGIIPQVESKLDALPDLDFTVSVSVVGTDHFARITYGGATLVLSQGSAAANKHRSAFKTLGFTATSDTSGLDQTGDTPMWTSENEEKLVVRVDEVAGVPDDGSGTYTGTPGARIVKAPDISYYLLREVVKFGDHQFNTADLVAARAAAPEEHQLVIGGLNKGRHESPKDRRTLAEYFTLMETGSRMDVYLHEGQWRWQVRDAVVPSSIITVDDENILEGSWDTWLEEQDVYALVRVQYLQDPSEGTWRTAEATNEATPYEHGRWQDRDFPTTLKNYSDVLNLLAKLKAQAIAPIRHFEFATQGRVFEVVPGQKLRHDRVRGMTNPDGVVGPVVMRLLNKQDDAQAHRSRVRAMTDVG